MDDQLPATIDCGHSNTGSASVTSAPSRTFSWTDEIGYGKAFSNAVQDLDQYDDQYKGNVTEKVNRWIEKVKCVRSKDCTECKKRAPFHVVPEDVEVSDHVHAKTGRPLKKGTISMERVYKVTSQPVRCMCPGQVVIGVSVTYRPVTPKE